jgi:hypothetical protein
MLQEHGSELLAHAEEGEGEEREHEQQEESEEASLPLASETQPAKPSDPASQRRSLFAAEEQGWRDDTGGNSSASNGMQGTTQPLPFKQQSSNDSTPEQQHPPSTHPVEHRMEDSFRPISAAFEARYPGYGRGMIARLMQANGDPQAAAEELQHTSAENSPAGQDHSDPSLQQLKGQGPGLSGRGDASALWGLINREVTQGERAQAIQDLRSQAFGLDTSSPGVTQVDMGDASGVQDEDMEGAG